MIARPALGRDYTRARVLNFLRYWGGPIGVRSLAKNLGESEATVFYLLRAQIEAGGYIREVKCHVYEWPGSIRDEQKIIEILNSPRRRFPMSLPRRGKSEGQVHVRFDKRKHTLKIKKGGQSMCGSCGSVINVGDYYLSPKIAQLIGLTQHTGQGTGHACLACVEQQGELDG